VALAGSVIDACGSPEQKKKYLGSIAAGQARATVALVEAAGSWDTESLKISSAGNKLTGTKLFVTDAAVAEFIVVVARDGIFVVDAKAPGLHIEPMKGMDLARKIYAVNSETRRRKPSTIPKAWLVR